jgi:hypothetical protein
MRAAGVLAMTMLLVCVVGGQQQTPLRDTRATGAASGRITGLVTTDDGRPRPLRRARVTLTGSALPIGRSVITADDGTFAFESVPPGRFTVGALKDGYVPMNFGATRTGRAGTGVQLADRDTVRIQIALARGAVITGTVIDVDGTPASGVSVSALSRKFYGTVTDYMYSIAGTPFTPTDDRGVYRIYGLPAGDYVISARPGLPSGTPGTPATVVQMMSRGSVSPKRMTFSQVFYPGVPDVEHATRVTVRAGEEQVGIDVQIQYVPLATITGTAISPAGFGAARVTLSRTDEQAQPPGGSVATADNQGRFQFASVAPGQYRMVARASTATGSGGGRGGGDGPTGDVQFAMADVTVNGEDVEIPLSLQPALSLAGRIVFEAESGAPPVLPVQLRASLGALIPNGGGGWSIPPAIIDGDQFRLEGIVPGRYRALTQVQGVRTPIGTWWLKSIAAGGRELLDAPLDIQQSRDDAVVTLSDRASAISGTLTAAGAPVTELWVVVFPADRTFWFVNSRRVAAVRPGREGRWAIQNLPPGAYRVAFADLDQNEWFDRAVLERLLPTATPLTIAGTEKQTFDLVVR